MPHYSPNNFNHYLPFALGYSLFFIGRMDIWGSLNTYDGDTLYVHLEVIIIRMCKYIAHITFTSQIHQPRFHRNKKGIGKDS